MDKSYLAIIAVLLILLAVAAFFNPRSESNIKKEIEKANYCSVKEDCVDVGGECPFGCYVFVNKNEAARISGLIDSYINNSYSRCFYSCMQLNGFDCISGKCQPIY